MGARARSRAQPSCGQGAAGSRHVWVGQSGMAAHPGCSCAGKRARKGALRCSQGLSPSHPHTGSPAHELPTMLTSCPRSQHPHHAFKRDTRAGTIPLAGVSFRLGDALKDPRPFPVPGRALLISWGLREAPELWSAHPSVAPAEAGGSQSSAAGLYSNCSPAASAAAAFGVEQSCCSAPRNATGGKKKKARRKSNPPAHPAGESLALPASS